MKKTSTILLSALALAASALVATAQDANTTNNNNNNNQGRGGRGNFNPEEFRQRMNDRMKTSLKVSDAEWGVLQPLIEKVTTKQRDAMGSRFGGRGFGGPRGGDQPGGTSTTPASSSDRGQNRGGSAESQALRTTLENESASPEEIKSKLAAVRESRKKSQAELDQAREELRKVVTVRQEAVLVSMGILE